MKVIEEKHATVNQAFDLLKKRQKESALSYEQQHTFNYLEDLIRLSSKDSAKLVKELIAAGLDEAQAVKVADLLPKKEDELKLALGGGPKEEVVKKVFEIVKSYKKEASEPSKVKKIEVIEKPKEAETKVEETADETQEKTEAVEPTASE